MKRYGGEWYIDEAKDGAWVKYSDAEAEILRVRNEDTENWTKVCASSRDAAVQRERKEIISQLGLMSIEKSNWWSSDVISDCIKVIRARGEQKPWGDAYHIYPDGPTTLEDIYKIGKKPMIARIMIHPDGTNEELFAYKINELIDAENVRRQT